jgi:hypothetical protein
LECNLNFFRATSKSKLAIEIIQVSGDLIVAIVVVVVVVVKNISILIVILLIVILFLVVVFTVFTRNLVNIA